VRITVPGSHGNFMFDGRDSETIEKPFG